MSTTPEIKSNQVPIHPNRLGGGRPTFTREQILAFAQAQEKAQQMKAKLESESRQGGAADTKMAGASAAGTKASGTGALSSYTSCRTILDSKDKDDSRAGGLDQPVNQRPQDHPLWSALDARYGGGLTEDPILGLGSAQSDSGEMLYGFRLLTSKEAESVVRAYQQRMGGNTSSPSSSSSSSSYSSSSSSAPLDPISASLQREKASLANRTPADLFAEDSTDHKLAGQDSEFDWLDEPLTMPVPAAYREGGAGRGRRGRGGRGRAGRKMASRSPKARPGGAVPSTLAAAKMKAEQHRASLRQNNTDAVRMMRNVNELLNGRTKSATNYSAPLSSASASVGGMYDYDEEDDSSFYGGASESVASSTSSPYASLGNQPPHPLHPTAPVMSSQAIASLQKKSGSASFPASVPAKN
jgi:hypothetical protein